MKPARRDRGLMRKGVLAFFAFALAALVAGALVWGTGSFADPSAPPPTESTDGPADEGGEGPLDIDLPFLPEPEPEPVRFLAWGDTGTGDETQRRTGEAAARVCAAEGCDFVLQLGDNVYPDGVKGVDDPAWIEKFEAPYANLSAPFYAALGNHDVAMGRFGDATLDNGDFQVRYAQREDRPSDKWTMPDRHYTFRRGDVQVVVLDLTRLAKEGGSLTAEAAQMEWLSTVWDEDARWRIAVSHFPYVSNGKHGDAGRYDGVEGRGAAIAEAVERYVCPHADVYLAGHDHDLQWLKPTPACGRTEFVVSGAAGKPKQLRPDGANEAWYQVGEVAGFFRFEVEGDRMTGRVYDDAGRTLFERTVTKGEAAAG